ncbi:MutS-related protein [Flavobacterium restrictum]|uniref:DNA mismatch repair protein n=1 Tax=Flavobacterium restrictum TaxID=2594428 RepID=A0A553E775_9FLAO|nr:DNA mismatch repair protein [Flavobacterium restrictum]TRX40898.1 DNA mismatch repair protein [Flavobacterium restrictum]
MKLYTSKSHHFSDQLKKINSRYSRISFFRLLSILLFLGSLYYDLKTQSNLYLFLAVIFFVTFIILMRLHAKLAFQKQVTTALFDINQNEIAYLERKAIPFENGVEFNDFQHPYAYDLDVFGAHSLFQNLNRTATYIGKKTLANQLVQLLPNDAILKNQEAIKELNQKLVWRQEFSAFAKISRDTKSFYDALLQWNRSANEPLSLTSRVISYATPLLFLGIFIAYLVTLNAVWLSYLAYVFVFNLGFAGKFLKRINAEMAQSSQIDRIIFNYSLLVQKIESEFFQSQKLLNLQQKLGSNNQKASLHFKKLSGLFSKMDSSSNFVTALLFNGTFLFNLHVLNALLQWKKDNATLLEEWLLVVGEFEMLNSLSNFSYNNKEFAFPELNSNFEIAFSDLSHPLLNPKTRIGNTVQFYPQSFMILTGSNMSGKSTFLRSLGINMVLAGIGAPVCASEGNVHPMPVLVSMRLSDSLSDSESYFFAEIKRLKQIMDALETQPAFVLLDEILRGTNSDDKRNGTIEVVKKVIAKQAIGAIATHDIEVCLTTNDYPNILTNNCFEVEIHNDELHFDYKLRSGICQNKSATFLMKKMGVI